jgi:hypothetical protein
MSRSNSSFNPKAFNGQKPNYASKSSYHKLPPVYISGVYAPFVRSGDQDGKYMFTPQSSQVLLSTYGTFNPAFIIDEIKKQSTGKELYVLGVKYRRVWNPEKNKMDGGDCQLTVTGTLIPGETFNDGMLRELREEVGGNIENIARLPQFSRIQNGRTFKTYFANVASLSKIPECEKSKTYSKNVDRTKKVEMAIIGTLDEFQMFFDRVDCRLNDDDQIDGCVLFSFDDFTKHCGV